MSMEKQGIVRPGTTPDTEKRLGAGEKQARGKSAQARAKQLDDDAAKRLSEAAARKLKR